MHEIINTLYYLGTVFRYYLGLSYKGREYQIRNKQMIVVIVCTTANANRF